MKKEIDEITIKYKLEKREIGEKGEKGLQLNYFIPYL